MLSVRLIRGMSLKGLRFSSSPSDAEQRITNLLLKELSPTKVEVKDISGGCGSMYNVHVESPLFAGKPMVSQHKMVTAVLKKEIESMHGLTIKTKASL